jgi:leucyl aminopeptidase (aminopeptidase T)
MTFDTLGLYLLRMLDKNFKKQPHETILFLSDFVPDDQLGKVKSRKSQIINQRSKYVELLYKRAKDLYGEDKVHFQKYPATFRSGKEIPREVIGLMGNHDIFLALTTYSLSYTDGVVEACNVGARGASMPGFNPDMFGKKRPMSANHQKMKDLGLQYIKEITRVKEENLEKRSKVRIIDTFDNTLTFDILGNNNKFHTDFGLFHEKGMSGNLPAGDIYIVPDSKQQACGTIAIPKAWSKFCSKDEEFLMIEFKDGKVTELLGAKDSLNEFLGFLDGTKSPKTEELKQSRRNLAEFGIGLNPYATKHESNLEAMKILGTIYCGIGTSSTMGGGKVKSDIHLNFVIPGASLFINDEPIITNGIPIFK